ncbi:MAG: GH36-type glycosyl hydrolase domain-containing protein [Bacteroidota bacterium]
MKKELNPKDFYQFDDANKEIIIKKYNTPTPWINYLSNGTFHTMLSHAGGGLAFYKSPQIWRINRYRFYHLPTDRSGFYYYIQDQDTKEYWCPTNEPVLNKPDKWKATHGMGYTRFNAEKNGLKADANYFVGKFENCLIWNLKLTNNSDKPKKLNLFSFVEFGMMEYMREISWACYMKHQMSVYYKENMDGLIFKYGVETQPNPDKTPLIYFASNKKLKGYDGDRDEFIGSYRSESNPYAIEEDGCSNSSLFGGDPCGALQMEVYLEPGQTEEINVFLGSGMTEEEIEQSLANCRKDDFVKRSYKALQEEWKNYLGHFECEIPDKDAQREINTWNPYQSQRNFLFSRNISFYATGTFRGVGFRDTSQDILSQTPIDVEASKDKIRQLLEQQYADGHTNHYFFPHENWEPVHRKHSDNHWWPVIAVWNVIMEEGKTDFLNETISFYDKGNATVYEHLKKSFDFTLENLGANGLPLMLHSDWNDQMFKVCREGKGESFWTSMQIGFALPKLIELAKLIGKDEDINAYQTFWNKQKEIINSIGWDGKWFRRAIMDSGLFLGTNDNYEAKVWLNAQSWAVLSGYVDKERAAQAMDVANEYLDTDLGLKLIHPSITTFPDPKDPLTNYNKGTGENASVFCHANTWAIIAECMLGRGDRAWKYYQQLIPKNAMDKAGLWRYKAEPYAYVSNIFGPESDKFGLANVSWLSGTAAWMYVTATQYILGIRPHWDGLIIDPCLPSDWDDIKIKRIFRNKVFNITIKKSDDKKIIMNGKEYSNKIIPFDEAKDNNEIIAYI